MKTKLTVAVALGGTLLATCFVSGSAQATSVPVLKSDAGMVTLVVVAAAASEEWAAVVAVAGAAA